MYGSYERTHSVFQNSDMMAKGKPAPEELALLEPFRGKVPDEVFGEPFVPPVSDGSGQDRALLRKRVAAAAGGRLRDQGRQARDCRRASRSTIEFLIDEPTFQPHHMPFIKNLGDARHRRHAAHRRSGAVSQRASTTSISTSRSQRFSFSATPGDSLRTYFSSQAAAIKGSQNLAGIADPAIDALIDSDHRRRRRGRH